MTEDLLYDDDRELIRFDADIHDHTVIVEVPWSVIEDYMGSPGFSSEQLLDFVGRNRRQIAENVAHYTRLAPDVTGMIITEEQLRGCS